MKSHPDDKSEPVRECPYCGIAFSLDGVNHDNAFLNFKGCRPGMGPPFRPNHVPPRSYTSYTLSSHLCPACRKKRSYG